MLTYWPRRRIASIVPSINSLRRSTLCWCQRRFRPSVLTVAAGTCFATIPVPICSIYYIVRVISADFLSGPHAMVRHGRAGNSYRWKNGVDRHRLATSIGNDGGVAVGLNGRPASGPKHRADPQRPQTAGSDPAPLPLGEPPKPASIA